MSEMPAREQMISAYSELVGLDPVRGGRGRAAPARRAAR
ncbi:PaaI family thioesterase, partial [Pseudomonas aeruginosa]|nr:PaaI family thioesterase [Pseudomonas aeruginosa]